LYVAKSQSQATAAASTFINLKQIDSWIMKLRGQSLRQSFLLLETQIQKSIRTHVHDETPSGEQPTQRTEMARRPGEIRNITSHGEYASMVYAALKELCILKHNITLYYIKMSEYTLNHFKIS
jgi:hypothetical protein